MGRNLELKPHWLVFYFGVLNDKSVKEERITMKSVLKSIAKSVGYEVRRWRQEQPNCSDHHPFLGYDMEQEAKENIDLIRANTMLSHSRLVTLYQQAVFCEKHNIAGSFVECGTWRGGAVGLMAIANLNHGNARRQLHLFDSFESVPEPDETIDGKRALEEVRQVGGGTTGKLVPLRIYESIGTPDLEVNRKLLEEIIGYDSDFIKYHKGWFQDTVPRDAKEVGDIAILRLDGDWYASTKVCLDHLYDQVVNGGFVIIDDYGYYEGCKAAVDEFIALRDLKAFLNHIDDTGRYWIKA